MKVTAATVCPRTGLHAATGKQVRTLLGQQCTGVNIMAFVRLKQAREVRKAWDQLQVSVTPQDDSSPR